VTLTPQLERAVDFVGGHQEPDGCWREWRLPPGESRMWTTAYVGYRLSPLAGLVPQVAQALGRAATWLRAAMLPSGGWGYSDGVGPDADSTALGILFLRAIGEEVPCAAIEALLRHQRSDGGFATYTPEWGFEGWVVSHPDVTATALRALAAVRNVEERRERARCYLARSRRANGLWHGYWWPSPMYATEAASACMAVDPSFETAGLVAVLEGWQDASVFETALRLLALEHLGASAASAAEAGWRTLRLSQQPDGGWPSAAVLRVTRRHIYEPWCTPDAGPTFRDERRLFTTATVVAALVSGASRPRRA
jgi:hypothetical protein